MAKKNKNSEQSQTESQSRQSRKEELRARKQAEQLRNIRIAGVIVAVILALIVIIAVVNEYVLGPRRAVATVGGEAISLTDFQDRVRFERAQRVISLEDQLEMLGGDISLLQQFSAQTINELHNQNAELFAEAILGQMEQDELIAQALADRGIVITEEDVEQRIEEAFDYYGGQSPPANPEPEPTVMPTPSVTPIGAEPAEDAAAVELETDTAPIPTATPVTEESFQEQYREIVDRYAGFGVNEDTYRKIVASAIASERLIDVLAEEQQLPEEDLQASAFLMTFATELEARAAVDAINAADAVTVWNSIRSASAEEAQQEDAPFATEILWQTVDAATATYGADIAAALFDSEINSPSALIEMPASDGSSRYALVVVTGREVRPLSEAELRQRKVALLTNFVDEAMLGVESSEFWRSRVPGQPILNPLYLQQQPAPTALPESAYPAP
jgi:SurA-like N-terminal domain